MENELRRIPSVMAAGGKRYWKKYSLHFLIWLFAWGGFFAIAKATDTAPHLPTKLVEAALEWELLALQTVSIVGIYLLCLFLEWIGRLVMTWWSKRSGRTAPTGPNERRLEVAEEGAEAILSLAMMNAGAAVINVVARVLPADAWLSVIWVALAGSVTSLLILGTLLEELDTHPHDRVQGQVDSGADDNHQRD